MTPVRQSAYGPKKGQVTVIVVNTTGTHIDIESGLYEALRDQIRTRKPLLMTADSNAVYYLWSDARSGETIDPLAGATGGAATQMAAVIFAGANPDRLELAPASAKGLVVRGIASGILRIWSGEG